MNETHKINLQIMLLTYVINPGAVICGLALLGIMMPNKGYFGFISNHQCTDYFAFFVGAVLMAFNFIYVIKLGKQKSALQDTYNKAQH